jgi:ABC-type protease/lipase transport system fused ATPase/permease subunit
MPSKIQIAKKLAVDLWRAEQAVDTAFVALTQLASTLPEARKTISLPSTSGQTAFDCVTQAITQTSMARASVIALHNEFTALQKDAGLNVVGYGTCTEMPARGAANCDVPAVAA